MKTDPNCSILEMSFGEEITTNLNLLSITAYGENVQFCGAWKVDDSDNGKFADPGFLDDSDHDIRK